MCYDLLNEKVILNQALSSVCLVDVYPIYFSLLKAAHYMFWVLKRVVSVRRFF